MANAGVRSFYTYDATFDSRFQINSKTRILGIQDGTSNTFMIGERYHKDPFWTELPTYRGWAWSSFLAGQDVLAGTSQPLNFVLTSASQLSGFTFKNDRVSSFGSGHTGGANFVFCDGSVRFMNNSTSLLTLQLLSRISDGQVVSLD